MFDDYRKFLPRTPRRGYKPPPPDFFTDVACPECHARPGELCKDTPWRGEESTAHPRRVDRALRARLDRRLKGILHG